jgi:hypothetical protein
MPTVSSGSTSSADSVTICLTSAGREVQALLAPGGDHQAEGAGHLARGERAGAADAPDVQVRAVLREVAVAEVREHRRLRAEAGVRQRQPELVGLRGAEAEGVGDHAVDADGLVVGGRVVVVRRVEVARDDRERDALVVRVPRGRLGRGAVRQRPERDLDDGGAGVRGVRRTHRVAVARDDERVPHPHRDDVQAGQVPICPRASSPRRAASFARPVPWLRAEE